MSLNQTTDVIKLSERREENLIPLLAEMIVEKPIKNSTMKEQSHI